MLKEQLHTLTGISDKAERFRFILFLFLVFSLPFDILYSSIIFLTFIAVTLVDIDKSKLKRIPKQVWIFQLIYFLGVAGYFYSYCKGEAGFLLERQLSMLLLPLLLPLAFQINRSKVDIVINVLTLSSLCAIAYLFVRLFILIVFDLRLPALTSAFSGAFFNHQFSRPLGIHAGYLSLYVSFSVFNLVYLFNINRSLKLRFVIASALILLFAGLFFLASRNTLIATFVILLFVFPVFNIKEKAKYIFITLFSVISCFFIVRNVPYLWERFSKELISEIKSTQEGNYINYSAEPRIERWKGGLELVKKSPLIGYGTGDERDMLKTEYARRGLYISYLEAFNAHNQYLSYLIKNGIPGFLVFLLAFIYYFRLAIRRSDFMYSSFLLLLIIGFYTENILDANKGILFFAIFNTLLGYNALNREQSTIQTTNSGSVSG